MDTLLINPQTKSHLERFVQNPSHAVLLTGAPGIGKTTLAEWLISTILDIPLSRLDGYAYYTKLSPDEKGTLSIESIRNLSRFLQLKSIGTKPIRRAVLVEEASSMTTEAQNAFLKLLEEPPSDTLLVLTSRSARHMLPTIISRVQTITVQTPPETEVKAYFSQAHEDKAVTQAYFLSGGLPGLAQALLQEDQAHPLTVGVAGAKEILRQTTYERLCMVDGLSKQKDTARSMIEALMRIAQTGIQQASAKQNPAQLKQWHNIRKQAFEALRALDKNGNAKLVLDNLFLSI